MSSELFELSGSPESGAVPPLPSHAQAWQAFVANLTPCRIGVAVALAVVAALSLSPIFRPSLPVLIGRTLVVSLLGLLAFSAAGQWPRRLPHWASRWVLQVAVVALTVPMAALLVYLISVGGDIEELLRSRTRYVGLVWLAGAGLLIGPLLAMGALYRQRDAEARSQALHFELERSELERQALDARLRLLQAQIEPHFLFNTLANVRALVETGSPRAAPVLGSLIAYLRAVMPRLQNEAATLGDELDLVRAYLEVMQLRMPDRLGYQVAIPAALHGVAFPAMALLTLVENAVRHGIDPSEEGGRIEIGAQWLGPREPVRLWVSDTGVGLQAPGGAGTGLRNLRERLKARFGPNTRLTLSENHPHGLRAEIEFMP